MATPPSTPLAVSVCSLHEGLGAIRLCDPGAVATIKDSLSRHGQLTAVEVFAQDGELQVLDGFKRLHAARQLEWKQLQVQRHELSAVEAMVRIAELHTAKGLTELEEAWLVRALVRQHGLSQGAVGERLGRHKSWICRRLMLAEGLEPRLQAWVRIGLVAPRAAVRLAALPRGNQPAACELVMQRGLTVRQTELLVSQLLESSSAGEQEALLDRWRKQPAGVPGSATRSVPRKARSEADWMSADILTLHRAAARLEARLMGNALCACPDGAQQLMTESLRALVPVLRSVVRTIGHATHFDDEQKVA